MADSLIRPPGGDLIQANTRSKLFKNRYAACLCAGVLSFSGLAAAQTSQEQIDRAALGKIRDQALNHSQITGTIGYLTDVMGPRLTGSANLKKADEYARDKLREWGLANAHLEAWPFGRGWSLEGFSMSMTAPQFSPIIAYPKAWSPGTKGTVRGEVIYLDANTVADLAKYRGKLTGKIVLFSPSRQVDPLFAPQAQRQTEEDLSKLANAPMPAESQPFQFTPEQRAAELLAYEKWKLLQSEGVAAALQPSFLDGGTVYVTSATVPYPPDVPFDKRAHAWDANRPAIVPQVVVSAEQYNRMIRLLARGIPVQVAISIDARFDDRDPMSYNVIAEIPGTDLKDEIVMIGASLDSWHSGTGATDNAAGAAVALEVIRVLQSLALKPRRTIRIGLWSAEEQGRLGSRAYVAQHLGSRRDEAGNPAARSPIEATPEYEKFSAYLNLDYGTGKLRGIYLQGNEAARPIFRTLLEPLADLGVSTVTLTGVGAADHISFDEIGLPGFQFIRDYMEGNHTRAPHTNMDVYEHVLEDDLKQAAAVAASVVYSLAMRDEKVPRKRLPRP